MYESKIKNEKTKVVGVYSSKSEGLKHFSESPSRYLFLKSLLCGFQRKFTFINEVSICTPYFSITLSQVDFSPQNTLVWIFSSRYMFYFGSPWYLPKVKLINNNVYFRSKHPGKHMSIYFFSLKSLGNIKLSSQSAAFLHLGCGRVFGVGWMHKNKWEKKWGTWWSGSIQSPNY